MTADRHHENTDTLIDALRDAIIDLGEKPSLVVSFSGGGDSSALLHAMAGLRESSGVELRAIHVNHGLHPDAKDWEQHCRDFAIQLGVAFTGVRVQVIDNGDGIESAARDARYAALFAHTKKDEHIVLAQHRDDQAETVLLRLLRGSGVTGLSAMRAISERGGRRLWRPWLDQPRSLIDSYCRQHGIAFIDDPANRDPRHSRSRLRQDVMPLLREHWPSADAALSQSAALLADDAERLMRLDRANLAIIQGLDPDTLSIPALLALDAVERRGVLRAFLLERQAAPIPARVLARLDELFDAKNEAEAKLDWAATSLRRYRDRLHLCRPDAASTAFPTEDWNGQAALSWGDGWQLRFEPPPAAALSLRVASRGGGERLQLPGKSHSQDLNKLLQEAGVPPWQRGRLPLLWLIDEDGPSLLAVGDLFRSQSLQALESLHGARLRCQPPAPR
ncbi:MAG: tRNA lysidine(34) synthetase TilS [Lysobacteraceae bacterium]